MKRGDFEQLVRAALEAIPAEFAGYLVNVAVVIEDEPSSALLRDLGMDPRRDTLYGLYEGTALPERPHDFAGLPDRITIYAGPLLRDFRGPALERQIRATIVHEIGHFFGLDEGLIRRLGY